MTTAAIMQPTYLPWAGYFHLLDQADVFVLLDTVQLDTRSWQVRNRIRGRDGNTVWLTVPVHAHRGDLICDVRIDNTQPWQQKHWRTIEQAYSHTPHWKHLSRWLGYYYGRYSRYNQLTTLTHTLIYSIAHYLRIDTPIYSAVWLPPTNTDRVRRLVDICHHVGADTLIESTGGTYLTQEALGDIKLEWHDYHHPAYTQGDQPFQSHLSVIDLIAWHGPDSLNIIRNQQAVAA